jgi:hypothetical protein
MDENIARMAIAAIIGGTIAISMVAMAIAKVFSSRRRKDIPESGVARLEQRLERMELAIDAMATEVERVAEGQRFTTRLLADRQVERQS